MIRFLGSASHTTALFVVVSSSTMSAPGTDGAPGVGAAAGAGAAVSGDGTPVAGAVANVNTNEGNSASQSSGGPFSEYVLLLLLTHSFIPLLVVAVSRVSRKSVASLVCA